MKLFSSLIAAAVLTSSAAFAGSPFLPISATNTFSSGERKIVEAAVAQAETEGKLVLIDMAAAWCGPCLALEKSEEENKADLAPTLAHFVSVKLEEMHLEMISGAEFIPSEVPWFPSLFVYNPANKKWTMLYAGDAASLKASLDDYLAHQSLSAYYVQRLMAKVQGTAKITEDDIMTAMVPLSLEGSGADVLAGTTGVVNAMKAKPTQFEMSVADIEQDFNDIYMRALEMGKISFDQIRAADPDSFADIATTPLLTSRILFRAPLGNLIRTQGNKAASDQCAVLSAKVAQALANEASDVQRKFQVARDLQCLSLAVQLKEKAGADVLAYEASMTEAERQTSAYELAKVFALTGSNFDKATDYAKIWKAYYEKALAKRPELLARVTAATDARLAAYAAGKSHP